MVCVVCEWLKKSVAFLTGGRGVSAVDSFSNDENGSASVEFVMVAPVFLAIVFSMFEAGWLMTQSMMLERGLDLTVRDLRLGNYAKPSHDDFKKTICENTKIIRNCEDNIVLEVVAVNGSSPAPTSPVCRDRTTSDEPVTTFTPGAETQITFIRACVIIDPIMPGMGLGLHLPKDESGGMALVTYSAYVSEPA